MCIYFKTYIYKVINHFLGARRLRRGKTEHQLDSLLSPFFHLIKHCFVSLIFLTIIYIEIHQIRVFGYRDFFKKGEIYMSCIPIRSK